MGTQEASIRARELLIELKGYEPLDGVAGESMLGRLKLLAQGPAGAEEERFDRREREPHRLGDLLVREAGDFAQDQDFALVESEGLDRVTHLL